jgi:hypothetical protein
MEQLVQPISKISNLSAQEGIITIEGTPIAARTDGSLQIQIHDSTKNTQIFWIRHYYVLPLEVSTPLHIPA